MWLLEPRFADSFVGCEAFEGLEPAAEIIGGDEVAKMLNSCDQEPFGGITMKRVYSERLQSQKPNVHCTGCGKGIDQESAGRSWVQQGSRHYCPSCARQEGLY